jgi:hypothetical protein
MLKDTKEPITSNQMNEPIVLNSIRTWGFFPSNIVLAVLHVVSSYEFDLCLLI